MSQPQIDLETKYDELAFDFIVGVSVLGAAAAVLFCLVFALFLWNLKLQKKLQKLDPMANFKLQRPKLIHNNTNSLNSKTDYDDNKNSSAVRAPPSHLQPASGDMNPIALRSKTSFDNGNFSFGGPHFASDFARAPTTADRNSKYY